MTLERLDAAAVVKRLARDRAAGLAGVAFDADGTLWSGDVGEDVFAFACEHELLLADAMPKLRDVAGAHGLSTAGSASTVAKALHTAYRHGRVSELLTCEVMTWCYAGHTLEELRTLAQRVLIERRLPARIRRELLEIFDFARAEGVRTIVVSASPHVVVTEALAMAKIEVDSVAASHPVTIGGTISASMQAPVPYGPEKAVIGARLLHAHDWLASFGDNVFDLEMLRAARIAVAVHPKPALVDRLHELPAAIVLE